MSNSITTELTLSTATDSALCRIRLGLELVEWPRCLVDHMLIDQTLVRPVLMPDMTRLSPTSPTSFVCQLTSGALRHFPVRHVQHWLRNGMGPIDLASRVVPA